ncbi:sorting nexin-22 [Eudromia elegans]
MIAVSIPAAEPAAAPRGPERPHTVFRVEVLCNGRRHTVAKRYSEFQALHKRLKKSCQVPDFPPRRAPNWLPRALEQRRQGLELYMRGILAHNKELPPELLDFLRLRPLPLEPKGGSPRPSCRPAPRPVLSFRRDPYARPPAPELLPDAVLSGVLQGLYGHPWRTAAPWGLAGPRPGS